MTMRHEPERIVADTNLLVSRLLLPQSVPARAVRKAVTPDTDGEAAVKPKRAPRKAAAPADGEGG